MVLCMSDTVGVYYRVSVRFAGYLLMARSSPTTEDPSHVARLNVITDSKDPIPTAVRQGWELYSTHSHGRLVDGVQTSYQERVVTVIVEFKLGIQFVVLFTTLLKGTILLYCTIGTKSTAIHHLKFTLN